MSCGGSIALLTSPAGIEPASGSCASRPETLAAMVVALVARHTRFAVETDALKLLVLGVAPHLGLLGSETVGGTR